MERRRKLNRMQNCCLLSVLFLRSLAPRSCVVIISPNDSSIIAKLIQFSPSPSPLSFSEVLFICPVGRLFRHKTEDSDAASSVKAAIHCHQNDPSACTAIYSFCRMMSDVAWPRKSEWGLFSTFTCISGRPFEGSCLSFN